jgi:opacity protein-like surface antigen
MKKIFLLAVLTAFFVFPTKAQINIGVGATYVDYGSSIGKPAPGIQVRGAYNFSRKLGTALGLAYNIPIKQTSSYYVQTSNLASANLMGIFHVIGGYEDNFSLYIPAGVTYVFGKSTFKSTDASSSNIEDENLSGLAIGAALGLQFNIGTPFIFTEAGFALPNGTTSNSRTGVTSSSNVPFHTTLSLGLRFPLGGGPGYGNKFF